MKLIDGEHLKEELLKSHFGSWVDVYPLIEMIDREPEVKPNMMNIFLIPVIVFIIMLFVFFLYL